MNMKGVVVLLAICFCCACTPKSKHVKNEEPLPLDSLVQKYENEFFSIMCPQGWTAEWEDYLPDNENMARIIDSLNIKGGAVELWAPDGRMSVRLVKSIAAWLNPYGSPKQWCELSMLNKQADDDCIGMSEITDSIIIDNCPASKVTFVYYNGADTLVQSQYAIVPKYQELYYANIKYIKGDEEAHYIGWKMLHTLQLKVR